MRETTRRRLLEAGIGIATVGVTGAAGCSTLESLTGGTDYRQWLHEPGVVTDADHYWTRVIDAGEMRSHQEVLPEGELSGFEEYLQGRTGISELAVDDVDTYISSLVGIVVTGSFDVEAVVADLESREFAEEADHEDFLIFLGTYEGGDELWEQSVGVSGDAIVVVNGLADVGAVETVVDTKRGRTDRYVDERENFEVLADELGDGMVLSARTHPESDGIDMDLGTFEGQVANGDTIHVNGETGEQRVIRVFASEDHVDLDVVERWIEKATNRHRILSKAKDIEISQSGRVVVITGTVDTNVYFY